MHFLISQIPAILLSAIFITVIMSTKKTTEVFTYSYSGLIGLTSLIGVLLHFSEKKDKIIWVILLLIVTTGLIGFVIVLNELEINTDKALVNIGLFFALIAFVVLAFTNSKRVIDKGETYFMTGIKILLFAYPPTRALLKEYAEYKKDLKLIETSKQKTLPVQKELNAEPVGFTEDKYQMSDVDEYIAGFILAWAPNIESEIGTKIFNYNLPEHREVFKKYVEKFNRTTEVREGEVPLQNTNEFKRVLYKYFQREDTHSFHLILKD